MPSADDWGETYQAQTLDHLMPWGPEQHLIIRRHDGQPVTATWDVLQQIKDDMLGPDVLAIEVYPPTENVVDEANWRHLWTVPLALFPLGYSRNP